MQKSKINPKLLLIATSLLFMSSLCAEDSFLWLEEVLSEKSLNWAKEENKLTESQLKSDPRYQQSFEEALKILSSKDKITSISFYGDMVYNFWKDTKNPRGVLRRAKFVDYRAQKKPNWETVLDIDKLNVTENKKWVYKSMKCLKPEYTHCMLKLSPGGSDAAVIREFNTKEKAFVKNGFSLPVAKSGVLWLDKDTLLARYAIDKSEYSDSGYPLVVRKWKRGMKIEKAPVIFSTDKSSMAIWPYVIEDKNKKKFIFLSESVDFYNVKHWMLQNGEFKQLNLPLKGDLLGNLDHTLFFETRSEWKGTKKGTLVSFKLEDALKKDFKIKTLFVPTLSKALGSIDITKDYVIAQIKENVRDYALLYSWDKNKSTFKTTQLDLPKDGSLSITSRSEDHNAILYSYESHLTPDSQVYTEISEKNGEIHTTTQIMRQLKDHFDSQNYVSFQYWATSKDGTKIPYTIVHHKDLKKNGKNATKLYGYGGFQSSLDPWYSQITNKLWLEKGGVFVVANIRGGGEFGPRWHQAALKENRQRSYDDFIAVAEDLISKKITSPNHLGIQGGSNGGLLVGVMLTQRPDLFNAVLCSVPLLDMMRYHKLLAGSSWVGEYGNPEDPKMREVILKYSPYQNLSANKKYPNTYIYTSTKDDRVHPGHARKMTAKMKELGHDVLYFENLEGGHSGGADLVQMAHGQARSYTFLYQNLMDSQ
jgi:prolyl oligopeptidase